MKKANQILLFSAFLLTFIVTKQVNVMQDTEEIWKDTPGTNYQASNTGRIRHFKTFRIRKVFNNGNDYLAFTSNTNGYKSHYVHRCVLMAFDPIENPEDFEANHIDFNRQNNNLNNLKWETRKANIQYSIDNGRFLDANKKHSDLMRERMADGSNPLCNLSSEKRKEAGKNRSKNHKKELHPFYNKFGEDSPGSILKEEDVVDIRRLNLIGGMPMLRISKLFSISYSTVNAIIYRRTWPHIL